MKKFTWISLMAIMHSTLFAFTAQAQFRGGEGDGANFSLASNVAMGRNIFVGGVNDGVNFSLASNQPFGRNIFVGGTDDGTDFALASNQPMGRNIFTGGVNDGTNFGLASNQPFGRNIFTGGTDDGEDFALASNQPLGRNIFTGGINDGWAMAFAPNVQLPITLTDFSGSWQQDNALLSWKTSMEVNASHFELEGSFDANNFTFVKRIDAIGQSTTERLYNYIDVGIKKLVPNNGTAVYYRLKSVDKDGTSTYSGVVLLQIDNISVSQYAVFPNPARDFIILNTIGQFPLVSFTMRLVDVSGKILMVQKITSPKQQFSVANFVSGTYFLQVLSSDKVAYTQKIIISK